MKRFNKTATKWSKNGGKAMQDIYTKEGDLSKAINEGQEKLKNVAGEAQKKFRQGQDQVQQVIGQVDQQLHENPWPIVAGVALGCLFLGFFAGNVRSRS